MVPVFGRQALQHHALRRSSRPGRSTRPKADVTTGADGSVIYALTRERKAIGRQLSMTQGEDARLGIFNELLDGPAE
jgi:hypothetical protein